MSESLRKCRVCGLEANNENELNLFIIYKKRKYGRDNICRKCHYEKYTKRSNIKWHPIWHSINGPKRIKFKGKVIYLKINPRINICSICGKSYPKELKQQTSLHHIKYDFNNILSHTIELCNSCHHKLHWKIRKQVKQHNQLP
jgi:hypothetical protein